jgi:hypothetical protein
MGDCSVLSGGGNWMMVQSPYIFCGAPALWYVYFQIINLNNGSFCNATLPGPSVGGHPCPVGSYSLGANSATVS